MPIQANISFPLLARLCCVDGCYAAVADISQSELLLAARSGSVAATLLLPELLCSGYVQFVDAKAFGVVHLVMLKTHVRLLDSTDTAGSGMLCRQRSSRQGGLVVAKSF